MKSKAKLTNGKSSADKTRHTRALDGVAYSYALTVDLYIHNIARMMRTKFARLAREEGLTRSQWQVLNRLSLDKGVPLSALAEMLEVELITAGRLVDKLECLGWVERRVSKTDKRVKHIYMLDAAIEVQERMHRLANKLHDETFASLNPKEYSQLQKMLEKLHGSLLASLSFDADEAEDEAA